MSKWIDIEKAIEDLQNGDPSQLYDVEDIKYWLNCLPSAQPEGRSGVFIPDITVKNLRKAPLEAVEELLVVGEMEDIVLPSAQPKTQKLLDDGTLIVHTDVDIINITRVNITQNNTHYGDLFYRDEE